MKQEQPRAAIANIPADSEFYIKPAANLKRCLSVCSDGFTKDPFEVFLTDVDPSSKKQKWRLVDGDTFQNVESGQYLHSATKYVTISNIDVVRAGTYTGLVTRPQDFSDAQRWVLGPEGFFGRFCLLAQTHAGSARHPLILLIGTDTPPCSPPGAPIPQTACRLPHGWL